MPSPAFELPIAPSSSPPHNSPYYRHPRESGGPGPPAKPVVPWIPAFAQGCPGKSGISESELVLNITRGLRDGWRFVELGDGSAFEQAGAHEVCKAQCQQVRAAVARGDAQQQISNHGGKDLQTNGVFGTAKETADFEMLLDPPEQQLDLPAFAIERGDTPGRALQIVAQDGEQTTILAPQHDAAQRDRQAQALLRGQFDHAVAFDRGGLPVVLADQAL